MSNTKEYPRILGIYTSTKPGPLLFISGGIHGNEPSGVQALRKVFKILEAEKPEINGTLVGVTGNKGALEKGVRYIDEDLNRTWTEENVKSRTKETHEKTEMFEIIDVLKQFPESDFEKRYFLDCHTTSSDSEPYISVQEVNDNDHWAHQFPPYIIRGFSDIVYGCIDHYLSRIGVTGFVFEGGQHESPDAVNHHEAMIWLALSKACKLNLNKLQTYPDSVSKMEARKPQQKTFEIEYRHEIKEGSNFKMQPGYENFQPIKKGELLAIENDSEIKSEWDAYIFMPLYQSQGNDGFFVVKEV